MLPSKITSNTTSNIKHTQKKIDPAINYTNLIDVKPFKTAWTIVVKIVHTWKQFTSSSYETIEMILADQEVITFLKSPIKTNKQSYC